MFIKPGDMQFPKQFIRAGEVFNTFEAHVPAPYFRKTFSVAEASEGEILITPRGKGGFGYDPLFWYDPMGKTLAEMTADEKNAISHRGAAVRQLAARIARRYGLVEDNG